MKLKFLLSLTILLISACSQATTENSKIVSDSKIVLIGDEIRNQVLSDCMKTSVCVENNKQQFITPPENADAVTTAQYTNQANQAILVVDSKSGPLPIIREHIVIARQTQVPNLAVLFADSEIINDKELMTMEVEEIKSTIDAYDMKDKLTSIYYGKQGLKSLIEDSGKISGTNRNQDFIKTQHIKIEVYNMTKEEMGVHLKNGSKVLVWISGQIEQAKIIAKKDIEQGEIAQIDLLFDKPIRTALAERLFFQFDKRIVSAGYVLSIK